MTARGSRGRSGFTLIEVIVVVAVVSILASMAVPYAVKFIDMGRAESTKKQMEEIQRAILGDPKGPTAGYLGDMGGLPAPPLLLSRLNTPQNPPGTPGPMGVKYGWDGPYVRIGFSPTAYLVDGWGRNLVYTPATGQIRSWGPDRTGNTADDIVYPPSAVVTTGSVVVNLHVWRTDNTTSQYVLNPQPGAFPGMQASVQLFYSLNGTRTPLSTGYPATPAGPPYSLGPTHAGLHEVVATCTLPPNPAVSGQAVAHVPGNNQQTVLNLYLR